MQGACDFSRGVYLSVNDSKKNAKATPQNVVPKALALRLYAVGGSLSIK